MRPALRWHGGKWNLAPWIIGFFPPHRCYVEPFGGAASVLIRKPRSYAEVYNDLDGDAVNLFRVLRSDRAGELIDALRLTPFAREEFVEASELSDDPIERARRLVIRSFMGFGSNGHNIKRKTGFRANSNRSGTTPARDWLNYPDALASIVERLQGVIIENRDAAEVMAAHDSPGNASLACPGLRSSARPRRTSCDR
jgi:DNA adenine methylase